MPRLVGGQLAPGLEQLIVVVGVGLRGEEIGFLLDLFGTLGLRLLLRFDDDLPAHEVEQSWIIN